MSDYMFMLENHLNAEQTRFLTALQAATDRQNLNAFLAGGAMRDMLGGFPLRDLDFVVEGNAVRMAKDLAEATGATIVSTDDLRKSVEMVMPGGSTIQLAMARKEKYLKAGGKAHVSPASIHEDLRCRDFTINSIALSVGKASRGLLLDPTNGLADVERRELRAVNNYVLYDDPVRLWRFVRLRVRLGFAVEERTASQYANAREAEMDKHIAPRALLEQLRHTANELNPAEVLKALDEEKLLRRVSPALTGAKLNLAGFAKLFKIRQLLPFGIDLRINHFPLFLFLVTEKLSPKERSAMYAAIGAERAEVELVSKLQARARKLEAALKSATMVKASLIYRTISAEPGEVALFTLMQTTQRLVADRIRNYLQKYVPSASEITDAEVAAEGLMPGTPKFAKRKAEMIAKRLDTRVKKPPVESVPELVQAAPQAMTARRGM
jgi:tRNA nucleotidyltransferase/poly(A) polymerase